MRSIISAVSVGLTGIATLVSCSGSSGGSVSTMQAASDIADAFCVKINGCSPFFIQVAFGDLATCEARESALFTEALGANGTGWTPSAVEACAQSVHGSSCDEALGHNLPAACHPPAGQLASGAACGDNAQCKSGYCNLGAGGKCGTCAAGLGGANATCYRDDDCAYGTVCVGASVTAPTEVSGHCTALGSSGATCDDTHPCLKTLACKGGTCGAPDAAGAACTRTATNFFGSCNELAGDYCSKATGGACTQIALAATGGACGAVNGGLTSCSASGKCPMTGSMSCVAPAADFANCNLASGQGCMAPADCIGGICTRPSPGTCR